MKKYFDLIAMVREYELETTMMVYLDEKGNSHILILPLWGDEKVEVEQYAFIDNVTLFPERVFTHFFEKLRFSDVLEQSDFIKFCMNGKVIEYPVMEEITGAEMTKLSKYAKETGWNEFVDCLK